MGTPWLVYDRVRETTTTTGTGTITLAGPVAGYQGFSAVIADAAQCYYCIADQSGANWEVGEGTFTLSGTTLARTTVRASSNSGSAVNFTSGTKDVFLTAPAYYVGRMSFPLFDHYADGGSTHTDGTEDDLYSDTLPASLLKSNGDKVQAEYETEIVGSATATRKVRAYFGGTKILDSGAQTFASGGSALVYLSVIRESSSVVRCMAEFVPSGVTLQPTVTYTRITGLTLANTQVLKITGTAASTGAASGDITAKQGDVVYVPAA